MRPDNDMTKELSGKLASYVLEYLKIAPEHVKDLERVYYDELGACRGLCDWEAFPGGRSARHVRPR